MEGLTPMTATEERNKPVDGRDVARRLRETGALDGLFEQIDSGDVEMTGARGLLPALLKEVLERGLRAELTEHLGYEKGEPTTSARGKRPWAAPRPRPSTRQVGPFETSGAPGPGRLVHAAPGSAKGQRRMDGLDSMIIGLYAGGMTAREIRHHLESTIGAGPEQGDDLQGHRRGVRCRHGVAAPASGGLLPGDLPRRDPRQGPRRPPGVEPLGPHRRGRGAWTAPEHVA